MHDIVFRYLWIAYIVFATVYIVTWWRRVPDARINRPAALFFANLPWLIMGAGVLTAEIETMFDIMDPRTGLVMYAFVASNFLMMALLWRWIFQRGGAELVAAHPPYGFEPLNTPASVRRFVIIVLLAGVLALVLNVYVQLQEPL